jgi:hypothetical protein
MIIGKFSSLDYIKPGLGVDDELKQHSQGELGHTLCA